MPAFDITFSVTVTNSDRQSEPYFVKVPIEADNAYEAAEKLAATLSAQIRARYETPFRAVSEEPSQKPPKKRSR